ncbi:TPA: KAP family P-loop domain protein [Pasteurella multocida]|uniref:KAP family P-loop NTPase fold protein n=1 Tax=Pasteurella multocida TaxID=747 RepID=UPI00202086DF|nr:P-loop NTPase fold protein [Pasteurella multocida]MCL7817497.1 P-loop NTPase fold protein [Pasteurella multocida]MEB3488528.1 P-loop NTPase fold protein [Pasteurella multocida]WRK06530.1 P-loop NTPase fold protein [Pasteurella multocida]HDR0612305.1 KAP family P-loop domain protein [Pasteurella multocida]HDR0629276.1 KAP family P-loop domain protein [Pasteurella multocida]
MWSDTESKEDYLNFGEVSQIVTEILETEAMLPVSIGVFGNWGAGKSSLLNLIEQQIEPDEWIIIKFDAWLYQGFDDARASLLEVIASHLMQAAEDDETIWKKSKNLFARIDGLRLFGLMAEGAALAAGIPTFGLISRTFETAQNSLDGIQDETESKQVVETGKGIVESGKKLIKSKEKQTPPQQIDEFRREYGEILQALGKKLVIVIDNLDRCLPANAIQTLEAIRLFLFLNRTAFIIAADEEMIRHSVAEHYKDLSYRHQIDYLDKLIQIPVRVPKAGVLEIRAYLYMLYAIHQKLSTETLANLRQFLETHLQQSWQNQSLKPEQVAENIGEKNNRTLLENFELANRIAPLLANSLNIHGNPRIVKRILNTIKMRTKIAEKRQMPLDETIITKLVIFERCVDSDVVTKFYQLINKEGGKPELLKELENNNEQNLSKLSENTPIQTFIKEWVKLEPKLSDIDLRAVIYLSRETIPLSTYTAQLSQKAQDALSILLKTTSRTGSQNTKNAIQQLTMDEQISVMETLVEQLRKVDNWDKKPDGFMGAFLLAENSEGGAKILSRFMIELKNKGVNYPWFKTILKNETWYKE